ncbi:MAG: DinB family protein [Alphaproteobacteria bacterium]|nr:DinB family protein [Alphaproteobacteria bacterium]
MSAGIRYLRAQAYNNAWANHRLLTSCGKLSTEELCAERVGFFPSIILTLNHIYLVDWFYISALEGDCVGRGIFETPIRYETIADLKAAQTAMDRRLIQVCEAFRTENDLERIVKQIRIGWVQEEPADRTLLHLFQHQIHHRGQAHAMLAETSVAPPQLDEFFLGHEREQEIRKEDFAALGFDETETWR